MESNRIKIITYKGKEIIHINYEGYSKLTENDFLNMINTATKFISSRGPGQLVISDMRNTHASTVVVQRFKDASIITKQVRKKGAVIGLNSLQLIFLNAVNKFSGSNLKAFNTVDDACQWLVEE